MIKRLTLLVIILLAAVLAGCQSEPALDQPPEIVYGEDVCDQCNMIISEPRFAAAYYLPDGTARLFDDIGNMGLYHAQHHEDVATFWVHDYDTEEWLDARQAFFVRSDMLRTPMGHGVVAFADRANADALAAEHEAMVMSFEELVAYYDAGEGQMDMDEHDSH